MRLGLRRVFFLREGQENDKKALTYNGINGEVITESRPYTTKHLTGKKETFTSKHQLQRFCDKLGFTCGALEGSAIRSSKR